MKNTNRRDFLKSSAAAGSAVLAGTIARNAHAAGNDQLKVGLIGCGGRGKGAAEQNLRADENVKLYAIADTFRDRADDALRVLRGSRHGIGPRVDVAEDRIFIGLDGYAKVIDLCDVIILATPPGFRPTHLKAAIDKGRHVFTEKPVAVDGPGAKLCLDLFETANQKKLNVVAGTQRRYETGYLELMKRVHDGAIGTILAGRCYWNQGGLWKKDRQAGWSDLEWQIRNWLYFSWLSGDHIVEQHVHNLDVLNWALRAHPVAAVGMGGRQVRTDAVYGNIFDHFAIDYEFPNGVHTLSMCRQIDGCENSVSEALVGTKGTTYTAAGARAYRIQGDTAWSLNREQANDPYLAEHQALYRHIRGGTHTNDLKNVAESTLTAIMGRMSCYTGKKVTWEQALNSTESLAPRNLSMDMTLAVAEIAKPGTTELR
jgi:predicted dehydrogenase